MNSKSTRVYITGTLNHPPVKRRRGQPTIYKRFGSKDTLYYRDEGKVYCICDDNQASGYVVKDHLGADMFLPKDFTDLISYEEARRMCDKRSVHLPKPGHEAYGYRVPPPLLVVSTPTKKRPMWNRDAINRHIQECLRRKQDAGIR
jgi:hypothetical protein